jgi:phosphoribosylanthranilate isomerase
LKVKICGITNNEDATLAEKLGADAVGFIFYKESKRYISPESASEIIKILSPLTLKVGVFVNENPELINSTASKIKLNAVQLHGNENPETINKINFHVIKSFRIKEEFDFNILNDYKNVSFLLDSYSEKEFGGTGKTFNWDLIPPRLKYNYILSGGVSVDNVEEIIKKVKPTAIDVSSSLETSP